jgi:hypothetical protein
VAIAGVGFASFNEAGASLFHGVVGSGGHTSGAATAHALVVHIKWLIGIFNDETVLHSDGGGWGQLSTLFFNVFTFFGGYLAAGRRAALRLGGWSVKFRRLALGRGLVEGGRLGQHLFVVLVARVGELVLFSIHRASSIETAVFKVKHDQVVKLLGEFKNSTKNEKLASLNNSCVAWAGERFEIGPAALDLGPSLGFHVEFPHVTELSRVVVLTTKSVKEFVLQTDRHARANLGLVGVLGVAEDFSVKRDSVEFETANVIHTSTTNETSEGYKSVFAGNLSVGMVISGSNLIALKS